MLQLGIRRKAESSVLQAGSTTAATTQPASMQHKTEFATEAAADRSTPAQEGDIAVVHAVSQSRDSAEAEEQTQAGEGAAGSRTDAREASQVIPPASKCRGNDRMPSAPLFIMGYELLDPWLFALSLRIESAQSLKLLALKVNQDLDG